MDLKMLHLYIVQIQQIVVKLGWIKLNSLNKKIKNKILKTKLKNFTDPIIIPGGFLILKIDDQKEIR